jgi:uncharacterized lipoprotein YmbA
MLASAPLLAGCSALRAQPDTTRYFVLSSVATSRSAPSISFDHAVGIGPVDVPDHLERQIVTRLANEEIDISDTERWSETLRDSLSRVIRENLVVLLGTERVRIYPWDPSSPPEVAVGIELLRFERTANGTVELLARCSVARRQDGPPMWIRNIAVTKPLAGPDTRAAVAALNGAVYDLSMQIAADVRRAPYAQTPTVEPDP